MPRMSALRQRASNQLPALSITAGWIAALALTAWLAAGWFWRLASPPSVILANADVSDPVAAARSITQRHLFAEATRSPSGVTLQSPQAYTLIGAMTASGKQPGFAILAEPGKPPVSAIEGEQFAPGITLGKVEPDKVTLLREGKSETLTLVTTPAPATAARPGGALPPGAAATAGANKPAQPINPPVPHP